MPVEELPESDYITYKYSPYVPRYYETNKMRYWLKAVNQSEGMPIRLYQHVAFYGGMAFWIPDCYSIFQELTNHVWQNRPELQFKEIIIWKTSFTFDEMMERMQLSIGADLLSDIPLIGSALSGISTIEWEIKDLQKRIDSIQWWNVWENLNYKHTAGNQVLQANYTNVINEILPLIIKKYGV